jgi:nuclear cap-binding protein subunit 1
MSSSTRSCCCAFCPRPGIGTLLTLCSCVEQPLKIPFAAAVVFYGNQIKSDITAEAIRRVGDRLQTALKAGQWKDVKLCLRFLACLQPLFEEDGIFAFLAQLFDTVVDQQSANENDVRARLQSHRRR